jgi:hypothetical protein
MTRDPVFSENPSLPPVSNRHVGTLIYHCGGDSLGPETPVTVVTPSGLRVPVPDGIGLPPDGSGLPGSLRIETLSEEGPPALIRDNRSAITALLGDGDGGCAVARGRRFGVGLLALLLVTRAASAWRRRRWARRQ